MNESSEVKVLVRSASNLSGRSIKRNLLHRKHTTLYSTWVDNYGCRIRRRGMKTIINREEITSCTCLNPSVYGMRHDRRASLSKLGRSYGQPILFRMAKTHSYNFTKEIEREVVRLADEPVVAVKDMDNITYPSKGALDVSSWDNMCKNHPHSIRSLVSRALWRAHGECCVGTVWKQTTNRKTCS